eukprot:CFRG5377T1
MESQRKTVKFECGGISSDDHKAFQSVESLREKKPAAAPEWALCPITQELLVHPVVCIDGHSYEKYAIRKWFESGKHTSPLTNESLTHKTLVPNLALQKAIDDWLAQPENSSHRKVHGQISEESEETMDKVTYKFDNDDSVDDDDILDRPSIYRFSHLQRVMKEGMEDPVIQCRGCEAFKLLGRFDDNRIIMGRQYAHLTVQQAMRMHRDSPIVSETACQALVNLALDTPANILSIWNDGVASDVYEAMKRYPTNSSLQQRCLKVFVNLSSLVQVAIELELMGLHRDCQSTMKRFRDDPDVQECALLCLSNIVAKMTSETKWIMVSDDLRGDVLQAVDRHGDTYPNINRQARIIMRALQSNTDEACSIA